MTTPHLRAEPGDFADTVLMPGDPLRARFIAETFLDSPRLVTDVRAMEGWTGTFNGTPISVQGSGMGVPSMLIYCTELIRFYDVKRIVRVGSCGALQPDMELGDLVVGIGAGTDSGVNRARLGGWDFCATADFNLARSVVDAAEAKGVRSVVGNIFTSDFFYGPDDQTKFKLLSDYGFLAVEMEAAGLYGAAAEHGIAALAVCTVSDHIARQEVMSPEERQTSFGDMIESVLDGLTA